MPLSSLDTCIGVVSTLILLWNNSKPFRIALIGKDKEDRDEKEAIQRAQEEILNKNSPTRKVIFRGFRDPDDRYSMDLFAIIPFIVFCFNLFPNVQGVWDNIYNRYSYIEAIAHVYALNMIMFYTYGLSVLCVDYWKHPEWLAQLKMQPDVGPRSFVKLMSTLVSNTLGPAIYMGIRLSGIFTLLGIDHITNAFEQQLMSTLSHFVQFHQHFPTVLESLTGSVTFLVTYDIMFYYSHRLLHHPAIYPLIHKQHHEYTAPTSLAAAYAHPVEHIVSNMLPSVVSAAISRPHIFIFYLYSAMGLIITLTGHSGYYITGDTAHFHDIHHEKFIKNYGLFPFFDRFHGTWSPPRPTAVKQSRKAKSDTNSSSSTKPTDEDDESIDPYTTGKPVNY